MNKHAIIYRPTWAEINLDNLEYNFRQIKIRLKPDIKVLVCVKADAYGHGAIPVSQRLARSGLDYLGVASIEEAIELRQANLKLPILIMGITLKENLAPLLKYNLIPTVCTFDYADALNKFAAKYGRLIKVHIKVDTGMGRIGVLLASAKRLIQRVSRLRFLKTEGIFTHLPCADVDQEFTLAQLEKFAGLLRGLKRAGINIDLVHAANSMGVVAYPGSHFNMVRPGLIIYGLNPKARTDIRVKPVLSLKTKVIFVKKVPRGCGISYGHTYITDKETTIVTLPVGYGDGYPRNLSNKGPVLIKGQRFKVSGRVCMDQMMVDVGKLNVQTGEEVVLIGSQGKNRITAEELAALSGTIPYEIVCGLSSRIPRIYI